MSEAEILFGYYVGSIVLALLAGWLSIKAAQWRLFPRDPDVLSEEWRRQNGAGWRR